MRTMLNLIFILILCFSINSYAATTAMGLDIAGNAYEKNIGYGGVSLYNNFGGISYNPAIIPNVHSFNGSITYINYILDFNMVYGNFLYPNVKNFNILGKFGYFYMPAVPAIEDYTATGEEYGYREFFIGTGTGYHFLNKKLSVGATVNFYSAKIANDSGSTFYFDIGTSYPFIFPLVKQHKIILGLSVLNLGPGVKFIEESCSLPSNFNLGFQYIYDYNYKLFGGLKKYTAYEDFLYSMGGEIIIANSFFLRTAMIEDLNKNLKYNLGLGFDLNYTDYHFLIDYVFLPLEAKEPAYIVTLSFKFPVPGENEEDIKKEEKNWKNLWTSE